MGKYPDSGSEAHISFISRIQVRARMADQTPVEGEEGTMPPTYDAATGLSESAEQKVNIAPSDTKIEMGKEKEKEEEGFKGLSKEELMQFANDPFWVRLRWTLFVLFWIVWVAMLVASVVIIIYAPKCPSPEAKQWWQKGPVYKSPVENFPDGNGDNERDLKDVEENVDYLVGLGVGSVYLTSVLSAEQIKQTSQVPFLSNLGPMQSSNFRQFDQTNQYKHLANCVQSKIDSIHDGLCQKSKACRTQQCNF